MQAVYKNEYQVQRATMTKDSFSCWIKNNDATLKYDVAHRVWSLKRYHTTLTTIATATSYNFLNNHFQMVFCFVRMTWQLTVKICPNFLSGSASCLK